MDWSKWGAENVASILATALLALFGYLLPIFLPEESFDGKATLVYDSVRLPISSAFLVEDTFDNEGIYTLRKMMVVTTIYNPSEESVTSDLNLGFYEETDVGFANFNPEYYYPDRSSFMPQPNGSWKLSLKDFRPGDTARVVVFGDKELDFQGLSIADREVVLVRGGRSLFDEGADASFRNKIIGASWTLISILILYFLARIAGFKFKIGRSRKRVADA